MTTITRKFASITPWLRWAWCAALTVCAWVGGSAVGAVPAEPIDIGTTPQFFVDDHVVDNRWAIKFGNASKQMMERVLHHPRKHPGNPVLTQTGAMNKFGQRPSTGWPTVLRDEKTGRFRMWYQVSIRNNSGEGNAYGVAYAESADGLKWELPRIGKIEWNGTKENNIVWRGQAGQRRGLVAGPRPAGKGPPWISFRDALFRQRAATRGIEGWNRVGYRERRTARRDA